MSTQNLIPFPSSLVDTGSRAKCEGCYTQPYTSGFAQHGSPIKDLSDSLASGNASAQFMASGLTLVRVRISEFFRITRKIQAEDWLPQMTERLSSIKSLNNGWDGYDAEPPTDIALRLCQMAIGLLHEMNFRPARIAPSVDGGIALCFFVGEKYADLECCNSGEIAAIIKDRVRGFRKTWDIDPTQEQIKEALREIREFIG
jgi:hypothetical protein